MPALIFHITHEKPHVYSCLCLYVKQNVLSNHQRVSRVGKRKVDAGSREGGVEGDEGKEMVGRRQEGAKS